MITGPRQPNTTAPDGAGSAPAPAAAARLVPLEPGLHAFTLAPDLARRQPAPGLSLPAVHVCAPPQYSGVVAVVDAAGREAAWLDGNTPALFVRAAGNGAAVLVTAYPARDPTSPPLQLRIAAVDRPGRGATVLELAGSAPRAPQADSAIEVVAHIRGRGDVRFVNAPWIGRLGPGLWIEAFTILPHDPVAAAAIEYKGLSATGAETPWLGTGALCGSRGRALPLIGFAVRQKGNSGGALFDCEYAGYFRSGAIAGPTRNGAPCRSPVENDPLEGMQLRITPRPPRSAAAPAGTARTPAVRG